MQIPVINGIYTNESSDFRTSYPINMVPVPKQQGISSGYLRPAEGVDHFASGPGKDRGAINWNGECYRVMGLKLVKVYENTLVQELGTITGTDTVTFDYSFDRLAIAADNKLYYWDGSMLTQVTDPDLGPVLDAIWVDGFFMTTDGESLVVTDLSDPFSVNPLKYGSSEADPDPVKALVKVRNEPHALNRYTIEAFDNIGGGGFPFQRIDGAQIQRGTLGSHTCCLFLESIAFVGGGRNESIAIWLGSNGQTAKISTREIDQILGEYTEAQLSVSLLESRVYDGHQHLYLHLPDKTLVYDAAASRVVEDPVWFTLSSSISGTGIYRARHFVRCYNRWLVGDTQSTNVGVLTDSHADHWSETVGWEFATSIVYNEGRGALFHELELVSLSGRVNLNKNPQISTSYSVDGETWSQEKWISAGRQGQRNKRLVWLQQGSMQHWRIQRFRGTSDSQLSVARLEARIEPLMV